MLLMMLEPQAWALNGPGSPWGNHGTTCVGLLVPCADYHVAAAVCTAAAVDSAEGDMGQPCEWCTVLGPNRPHLFTDSWGTARVDPCYCKHCGYDEWAWEAHRQANGGAL